MSWASCLSVALIATAAMVPPSAGGGLQGSATTGGVALVYRGTPHGRPRAEDVSAIRAMGFGAVYWPQELAAAEADARRLGAAAGVTVLTADDVAGVAAGRVAIVESAAVMDPRRVAAAAWRRIQRGARLIVFDPQASAGTGLVDGSGRQLQWVTEARTIARQLSVNAALFESLSPGPAVSVATSASDLEVSLFQTPRSWVLFATSLDAARRLVNVALPPAIPAALWTSLTDGTDMSMLNRPEGPLWTFEMPPFGVQVYVIEKR